VVSSQSGHNLEQEPVVTGLMLGNFANEIGSHFKILVNGVRSVEAFKPVLDSFGERFGSRKADE
jgi:hypothetical protein